LNFDIVSSFRDNAGQQASGEDTGVVVLRISDLLYAQAVDVLAHDLVPSTFDIRYWRFIIQNGPSFEYRTSNKECPMMK
jgi:hypothetical protein